MRSILDLYQKNCKELCCVPVPGLISLLSQDEQGLESEGSRLLRITRNCEPGGLNVLQLTALCQALTEHSALEYLDLSYNDRTPAKELYNPELATFGNHGAEIVSRLMRSNASLRYVILEGNAVGHRGASSLATILSSEDGSHIEALNLAGNPIGDEGAAAFALMLKQNNTLKMLDLGGCQIGVRGLMSITECLAHNNTTLESIGLEDCRVMNPPQSFTTRSLAQMFRANNALKQVYLSKHGLHDYDLEMLVDYGLTKNHAVQVLDLHANSLSGMCAMSLARLLQENCAIQVLNLANNRISDECVVAIVESLPCNHSLKELDVRSCGISDAGLEILSKAVMNSTSLKKLFVWGNECCQAAAAAWRDLCVWTQEHGRNFVTDAEPYEVDGEPILCSN